MNSDQQRGDPRMQFVPTTPTPLLPTGTILDEAKAVVYGRAEKEYGDPYDDFNRIAKMWSAILGVGVSPDQVPICMIALKLSRLCHGMKRDTIVDIAGWAATIERLLNAAGVKP